MEGFPFFAEETAGRDLLADFHISVARRSLVKRLVRGVEGHLVISGFVCSECNSFQI